MKSHPRWASPLFTMTAIFLAACGGSSAPPPKNDEVPIGTESSKREAKRPDPDQGEDVTTPAPGLPAAAAPDTATAEATPELPAPAAPTTKGSSRTAATTKAGKGGGGTLTKAECDKMADRYIEVVVTGEGAPLQGMSGKELEDARNMIRSSVAQNPNFIGFKGACLRDLNKSQYNCAMSARTLKDFNTCIQ